MKILKRTIRKLLFVKEKESIRDAINRHQIHLIRFFQKKLSPIEKKKIENELKKMNIQKGDTLMVHASWRNFYRFNGDPEDVIDMLLKLIGEEGTLLMPCFGDDLTYFDVNKTSSQAGALSETFRKMPNVLRSESSHFSVCGCGKNATSLLNKHKYSEFGFDQNSPYYLFSQLPKTKILNLGLGKYPIKTTLIHCVEYIYKDIYPYYNKYLSKKYTATVIDQNGIKHERKMIKGTYAKLHNKNILKLYKNIPQKYKEYKKIGNIDIRLIDANVGFKTLDVMTNKGIVMLKPPFKNKNSFKKTIRNS